MAGSVLARKLKLKPGARAAIIGAPEGYLKWVTLVSVNAIWSAFALRPYRPGEPRQRAR